MQIRLYTDTDTDTLAVGVSVPEAGIDIEAAHGGGLHHQAADNVSGHWHNPEPEPRKWSVPHSGLWGFPLGNMSVYWNGLGEGSRSVMHHLDRGSY
jgi:hypothetical protein